MFEIDLLFSFLFMALLFLRQISIIKDPNKINYAPLIIGIGIISGILHFTIQSEDKNLLLLLKESFLPVLVSLLLYIVMNILHQTQKNQDARAENISQAELYEKIEELKEFSAQIEKRVLLSQNQEQLIQDEMRERFRHDIKTLDSILNNQNKFLEKFDELRGWHFDVTKSFENFTEVQLPSLDNIVHKHIDILRLSEQDHFNKVKAMLEKSVDNRDSIKEGVAELKASLDSMNTLAQAVAKTIVKSTQDQLFDTLRTFTKEIVLLKSHTESINTALFESENTLGGIKDQSEMIMKQMILSSKKMSELQVQNGALHDIYLAMKELMRDVEAIKSEYTKSESQLSMIVDGFNETKEQQIDNFHEKIQITLNELNFRMDEFNQKLSKYEPSTTQDLSQSVQFLSKQAQLKNRYTDLESQNN